MRTFLVVGSPFKDSTFNLDNLLVYNIQDGSICCVDKQSTLSLHHIWVIDEMTMIWS